MPQGSFHKTDRHTKVHRLTEDLESAQAQSLKPQLVACRGGDQDDQRLRSKGPKLPEYYQTIQAGIFQSMTTRSKEKAQAWRALDTQIPSGARWT